MNFTQEKKIDIGGKKRLVKFGTNASMIYSELNDVPLSELQTLNFQNVKIKQLVDMIYAGLAAGHIKQEGLDRIEDVPFSPLRVGEWIDEVDEEVIQDIYRLIQGPDTGGDKKKTENP